MWQSNNTTMTGVALNVRHNRTRTDGWLTGHHARSEIFTTCARDISQFVVRVNIKFSRVCIAYILGRWRVLGSAPSVPGLELDERLFAPKLIEAQNLQGRPINNRDHNTHSTLLNRAHTATPSPSLMHRVVPNLVHSIAGSSTRVRGVANQKSCNQCIPTTKPVTTKNRKLPRKLLRAIYRVATITNKVHNK